MWTFSKKLNNGEGIVFFSGFKIVCVFNNFPFFAKKGSHFKECSGLLKNGSCFLQYSETSYLKISSIERKSRLNNSWAFSGVRWRNKTLKCPRSMNGKIADWFLHTRRNREAKCSFFVCTQGFACTYNSH